MKKHIKSFQKEKLLLQFMFALTDFYSLELEVEMIGWREGGGGGGDAGDVSTGI